MTNSNVPIWKHQNVSFHNFSVILFFMIFNQIQHSVLNILLRNSSEFIFYLHFLSMKYVKICIFEHFFNIKSKLSHFKTFKKICHTFLSL